MRHLVRSLLLAGLSLLPLGAQVPKKLSVAAAANLREVFPELKMAFEKRHPGVELEVSFGSSGNFYAQLGNKAPFDVFLSADTSFPDKLAASGATEGKPFPYARGRLVLFARKSAGVPVSQGLKSLTGAQVKRIALANPVHAPYGQAAEAALRHAKLYEGLKEKFVIGQDISQTAQYVLTGSADAGFIALSQALSPKFQGDGIYWEVPADLFPSLLQSGAIIKWTKDPVSARAFRDFLLSKDGQAILKRFGYLEAK